MIYLDNSSTTKPNKEVMESFITLNEKYYANPASLHCMGKEAENFLERSKLQMLAIAGNKDGQVVLTSGGTESNNLAIMGFAQAYQSRGNHIITTSIEHHSVLKACYQLEKMGFEVDYLTVDESGLISLEELKMKIRPETILVSIMHVNNEIGTIQPIRECATIIKSRSRAIFHSDCVQSFGKIPVTVSGLGVDAITVSSHKINGLKNSGALLMKKGVIPHPILFGGGQENGLRSGTVSLAHAVALAKAFRLSAVSSEMKDFRKWRNEMMAVCHLYENIQVLCPDHSAPHILAISFKSIKGEVAVNFFQENGVIISTSSACSSKAKNAGHVIEAIQLNDEFKHGVIRISFGNNNTNEQIEKTIDILKQFMDVIEKGM
ncbi:cysteine desulfurase family protein [Sporosarcina oncorhynchi]|uniref:Cysteine desulfurase family protein n=1 Tax=Sporosarcina oncorhynchi TaxID=3056444 RepID=A0ABZ0L8X0_9BACL|nr:cysteine desulfurase family protein [Sporosarcina sp. T2O-4]WOV88580.1 cysteine desulfurase family protein [Sporosarcina sp. T2O-4]